MNHQKITVNELIAKVTIKLKNAQYSDLTIKWFVTVWNNLKNHMSSICVTVYTVKIGMDFLETEYGITVSKKLTQKNRRCARAINLFSDYLLHGIIFPRTKQAIRVYHPQFQLLFQGYINQKRTDGLSEKTLKSYEIYLSRFSDYLNSRGIKDICDMDEVIILGFSQTFVRYSPTTIHNTLCSLRTFFHYLFQNGFVSNNFAYIVPNDRCRQRAKAPSAYSKKEVKKLLKLIGRGNPKGKRNYAIILIAARLGLRAQDICNLSFNNLKWKTNTIELLQEKTKKRIVLPMLEDVDLAIIDYLKYARPDCESTKEIFLRLTPPIGKLNLNKCAIF